MADWLSIIETELSKKDRRLIMRFLRKNCDDDDADGYIEIYNAGGWLPHLDERPFTRNHLVRFFEMLVRIRSDMNRRSEWDYIVDLVIPDAPGAFLGIIARATGMTDDEAFPPHLDPSRPEGKAVFDAEEAEHRAWKAERDEEYRLQTAAAAERAAKIAAEKEARIARRRRIPVADPARQQSFKLTFDRDGLQAHIEAHIRAWLPAGVPSPIAAFLKVRYIRGGAAARVTLFDGEVTTVFAHGPLGHVAIRTPTAFFFHAQERRWVRAPEGLTREQAYAEGLAV